MRKKLLATLVILTIAFTGCNNGNSKETDNTVSDLKSSTPTISSENITKEPTEETKDTKELQAAVSDTVLWFNGTYGIITSRNGGDISLFGGYKEDEIGLSGIVKQGLKDSWEVTDKKSAEETLQWILEEGHNKELLEMYSKNGLADYSREELVTTLSDPSYTDVDKAYFLNVYDAVAAYGDNAILAWDLSRAMQLSSWYYLAGYYTYEEALDSCLDIGKRLQETYDSWDDMMDSYFYGFQYWNEDDINDPSSESYTRAELYESLKEQENSPYSLDWNMELKKDW